MLKVNKGLKELSLKENSLTDEGVSIIVQAFTENNTLTSINLVRTDMTEVVLSRFLLFFLIILRLVENYLGV